MIFHLGDHKARATRNQKEANGFERQKNTMNRIDLGFFNNIRDWDKLKKYDINYKLFNGKLDIDLYDDPICFNFGDEEVSIDYQNISHYPLISQIANAMVGEQINRPFKPMVKDNTPERQTYLKKEFNSRIQQHIQQNILGPKKEQVVQQILQQAGITDLFSLGPDEQMQLAQQVEQTMQAQTPKEIMEFLQHEYQTPTAKQAQRMIDHLTECYDIRAEQIEGFKHAVVTAEEYYYQGVRNEELVFETVPPAYFEWGGSHETEWVQHGTWARRERWLAPEEAITRHALAYTEANLKQLEDYCEPIGGSSDWYDYEKNEYYKKIMYDYSRSPELQKKYEGTDIKTRSGQERFLEMQRDIFNGGEEHNSDKYEFGVREAHIVWRDKRLLKRVTREINGEERKFYVSEHYKTTDEDKDVQRIWVDEVWEGYKIGTYDAVYVGVQPVPCQYRSLDNPFKVDLPYIGKRYNTHRGMDNSNPSLIDIGKTLQKDFDTTMASIKHDMTTNFGQQFIMSLNTKPEDWKWQDMIDSMRNVSIIPTDTHKLGINAMDANMSRAVNMSKMSDIAGKIQFAETTRRNLSLAMYFNDSRIGAIGQYATNSTTESNQVASYNQTALFFEQHRKVVEKAMYGFLNTARHYYKDNPEKAALFLDDVSMAELMTGPYSQYKELGISLSNSGPELQKLNLLKQQMLGFIQNGASPESVMQLIFADTEGEVKNIIKRESEKLEKQRQEAMQAQQQQAQMQQQTAIQVEEMRQSREDAREQAKLQSQERRALIDQQKFAIANDADHDGRVDLLVKAEMDNETKILLKEMDLKGARENLKEKLRNDTDNRSTS